MTARVFFIAIYLILICCSTLTECIIRRKELRACLVSVGISKSGQVGDAQITSSSDYSSHYSASKARLGGTGAWCPALLPEVQKPERNAWLQIDLIVAHFVCEFAVQGNSKRDEWVTMYWISYSMDAQKWKRENYFLHGSKDRNTKQSSYPPLPRFAKYVRFTVIRYHTYPCMRVELYGKKVWDLQSSFIIYLPSKHTHIRVKPNGREDWDSKGEKVLSVHLDLQSDIDVQDKSLVHHISRNDDIFVDLPPMSNSISPGNKVLMVLPKARYLAGQITAILASDLYEIRRSDNGKTEVLNRAYIRQQGGKPCDMDNECPTETHCTNDHQHRPAKYYCVCKKGFTEAVKNNVVYLEGKCVDINECSKNIANCPDHSRCINTFGSFHCSCNSGYTGSSGGQCIDVDECALTPSVCSSGFSCINSPGSFKCEDIDECLTSPCWVGELCVNTYGSFNCRIPPTSEQPYGKLECLTSPCWEGELCVNTHGSFNCRIPSTSEHPYVERSKKSTTVSQQPREITGSVIRPTPLVTQQMVVNGSTGHALNHFSAFVILAVLCTLV